MGGSIVMVPVEGPAFFFFCFESVLILALLVWGGHVCWLPSALVAAEFCVLFYFCSMRL